MSDLRRHLRPPWTRDYGRAEFAADALAGVIVTVVLIPQSLAYAMLAGLPAETGIYASILPVMAYALFGSSRVLAVGPVAVLSLMTASAVDAASAAHAVDPRTAASLLAVLTGLFLVALGLLRLGWIVNFLSHSVVTGFVSASAILIALGQLPPLLGVEARGSDLLVLLPAFADRLDAVHPPTIAFAVGTLAFLVWVRIALGPLLARLGAAPRLVGTLPRLGPVVAVVAGIVVVRLWHGAGLDTVGAIPGGLPVPALPVPADGAVLPLVRDLAVPALLVSLICFVESFSVGQALAARRRQRVQPDRELLGLGAGNLAAGFGGGFPVAGGFSRSVVNFDAGAVTPVAGILTGLGMALVALVLTGPFEDLPRAALAAVIMVAVIPLVDVAALRETWRVSRAEAGVLLATFAGVLLLGVELGIALGAALALGRHLKRTSRPHVAVLGRIRGTEHFRNVERHRVRTHEHLLLVRIDESLYFANARDLEDRLLALVADRPAITDLVLQCSAVNDVDASAILALETLDERLAAAGVRLHLAEVKGPVMDVLERSSLRADLCGRIFFTLHEAEQALAPSECRARD